MIQKKGQIRCPVCARKEFTSFWAMPGYKLVRCLGCSMVWDFLPKEDTSGLYDKTYFINENPKGGYANYFDGMQVNKRTFHLRLQRIEKRLGKKGRYLDVGCALGDCLIEAKKIGWKDIYGLEVSKYAYEFAKERGLNVLNSTLSNSGYSENYFDVVTYQDVLEHLKDSLGELKIVYKVLKKAGLVYIVTPDIDGLWRRFLGRLWYHYKPDEHISYFSQKTLSLVLKKAGFANIETRKTYHILSFEYVVNRLRYYFPFLFGLLLKLVRKTFLKKISFKLYIGEIEAWGFK